MNIPTIVYVLVTAHLIGDFWMQSSAMALGKSKDTAAGVWALTRHVGMVSIVLWAALGMYHGATGLMTLQQGTIYVAVNACAHWVTDFVTSRFNAKQWFVTPMCLRVPDIGCDPQLVLDDWKRFWFWRGIGSDQWIHYVTIFATAEWLLF